MSNRANAWLVFGLGLPVVFVFGFFTMFLAAQSSTGCDQSFGPGMTHPAFCSSYVTRALVPLLPLIAGSVYVIGSVVGIPLARGSRRSPFVPLALAVLAAGMCVLTLAIID